MNTDSITQPPESSANQNTPLKPWLFRSRRKRIAILAIMIYCAIYPLFIAVLFHTGAVSTTTHLKYDNVRWYFQSSYEFDGYRPEKYHRGETTWYNETLFLVALPGLAIVKEFTRRDAPPDDAWVINVKNVILPRLEEPFELIEISPPGCCGPPGTIFGVHVYTEQYSTSYRLHGRVISDRRCRKGFTLAMTRWDRNCDHRIERAELRDQRRTERNLILELLF